jgi:hypothetical protein
LLCFIVLLKNLVEASLFSRILEMCVTCFQARRVEVEKDPAVVDVSFSRLMMCPIRRYAKYFLGQETNLSSVQKIFDFGKKVHKDMENKWTDFCGDHFLADVVNVRIEEKRTVKFNRFGVCFHAVWVPDAVIEYNDAMRIIEYKSGIAAGMASRQLWFYGMMERLLRPDLSLELVAVGNCAVRPEGREVVEDHTDELNRRLKVYAEQHMVMEEFYCSTKEEGPIWQSNYKVQ